MVGHRRDGSSDSGGADGGLVIIVGDPLVHLVDDLSRGLESLMSSASMAPIPTDITRLVMFLTACLFAGCGARPRG